MQAPKHLRILAQPDDITCGPTSLHAVYTYYGNILDLTEVIASVKSLEGGGTLAVMLGIVTYDANMLIVQPQHL